jgi:hypothetical protein
MHQYPHPLRQRRNRQSVRVARKKRRYPSGTCGGTVNNKRKTNTQWGRKLAIKAEGRESMERKRRKRDGVTQHRTSKKHGVREEERLCKKLKQLITVRRLLSYLSPPFFVITQPSTLHHRGHNLERLGSVDHDVVQKFGNR